MDYPIYTFRNYNFGGAYRPGSSIAASRLGESVLNDAVAIVLFSTRFGLEIMKSWGNAETWTSNTVSTSYMSWVSYSYVYWISWCIIIYSHMFIDCLLSNLLSMSIPIVYYLYLCWIPMGRAILRFPHQLRNGAGWRTICRSRSRGLHTTMDFTIRNSGGPTMGPTNGFYHEEHGDLMWFDVIH